MFTLANTVLLQTFDLLYLIADAHRGTFPLLI